MPQNENFTMHSIALIGCGNIAGFSDLDNLNTHLGAIHSLKEFEIKAVFDTDIIKAKKVSENLDCLYGNDILKFLKSNSLDLITICTPDESHFNLINKILESNNPPQVLFVEKPICFDNQELNKIRKNLEISNTKLFVNHTRRFNQNYLNLRNLIKSGFFGELLRINAIYYGGWIHNGTHLVDTLLFLIDKKLQWIKINNTIQTKNAFDPSYEILGRIHNSNVQIDIKAIDENYYQIFDIDLWFSKGRLKLDDFGNEIKIFKKIKNKIGENVLYFEKEIESNKDTEMRIAYKLISKMLKTNSLDILEFVDYISASQTMKSIWKALELVKQ